MKLLLLTILVSGSLADNACDGVFFNNNYFNVEILQEGISNIHQIARDNNDNTLYFTFDRIAKVPTRVLGYINLDTKEIGVIDGIRNATGVAINNGRIYVGGSDGLFFLNDKKVPEVLPVKDDIRYLFIKDAVYYINGRREAYKFDHGVIQPLQELYGIAVDKLIADDDNNIFFLQNRKLSRVKIGTRIVNNHEGYVVDTISANVNFKPYVSTTKGVYLYNKYKYVLDKVSDIIDLKELTFNRNGEPIYVVKDKIVILNSNPIPCFGD